VILQKWEQTSDVIDVQMRSDHGGQVGDPMVGHEAIGHVRVGTVE